jgi:hypothetical protein
VHDLAAARVHAFPALYPAAAAGLPTLADPGYDASAVSQPGRKSYPAGRPLPGSTTRSGGTDSRPTAAAHREIRVGRPIRVGLLQAGVRVGPAAAAEHDGVQHAGADAEPAGDQLVAPAQALRAGVVPNDQEPSISNTVRWVRSPTRRGRYAGSAASTCHPRAAAQARRSRRDHREPAEM